MVEYVDPDTGEKTTYLYDALGRRIGKTRDAEGPSPLVTYFFYDGDRAIEEQDAAEATTATYVYGQYIDEVLSMQRDTDADSTPEDYFFHGDDLFNTITATNSSGTVVERYEYGPFGKPTIYAPNGSTVRVDGAGRPLSSIGNYLLFNGRPYDPETGLYNYRTRYLDPRTGRFTTRDTIGIWGDPMNLGNGYSYVGNNPWTLNDPYGLGPWSVAWNVVRAPFDILYDVKEGVYNSVFHPVRTWTGLRDSAVSTVNHFAANGYGPYTAVASAFAAGGASVLGAGNLLDGYEAAQRGDWDSAANSFTKGGIQAGLVGVGVKGATCSIKKLSRAGEGAAGRGAWANTGETMSARAAAYQAQITGRAGQSYILNGVKFDGEIAGTLLEAKGPGYANFVKNGEFQRWFMGRQRIIDQARHQLGAANGAPIQWHIAEQQAIPAFQRVFKDEGIEGIKLIHSPVVP